MFAFDGDSAAGDEQDQGEVGPVGLVAEEGVEEADGVAIEDLFGEDGGAGAPGDLFAELGDGGGDVTGLSGALDDGGDELRVSSGGREDEGAGL